MSDTSRTTPEPEFITARDAAKKFGIPVKTLESMRSRGVGPAYYKIGTGIRYRPIDVRGWVEQHRVAISGGAQ